MEHHRGTIVVIVVVVVVGLVGFWIWASPVILHTSKDSVSLLGIFKKGYEQAREQVASIKAPVLTPSPVSLSPEQVDQITERLGHEAQKTAPKLPVTNQRVLPPTTGE